MKTFIEILFGTGLIVWLLYCVESRMKQRKEEKRLAEIEERKKYRRINRNRYRPANEGRIFLVPENFKGGRARLRKEANGYEVVGAKLVKHKNSGHLVLRGGIKCKRKSKRAQSWLQQRFEKVV